MPANAEVAQKPNAVIEKWRQLTSEKAAPQDAVPAGNELPMNYELPEPLSPVRRWWFGLTTGFGLAIALAAMPVEAQQTPGQTCHKATEIAKQLEKQYGEAPVAMALQSNGVLIQVYENPETGTWTLVTTTSAGISCVASAGKFGWNVVPAANKDPMA